VPVKPVALVQKEFSQIRAVLSGDAGDQGVRPAVSEAKSFIFMVLDQGVFIISRQADASADTSDRLARPLPAAAGCRAT
jgi:hypothetical protein